MRVFALQNGSVFVQTSLRRLQMRVCVGRSSCQKRDEVSGLLYMDELFAPPSILITPVKFSTHQPHIHTQISFCCALPRHSAARLKLNLGCANNKQHDSDRWQKSNQGEIRSEKYKSKSAQRWFLMGLLAKKNWGEPHLYGPGAEFMADWM